jgi:preprotein translocase subunit YajC
VEHPVWTIPLLAAADGGGSMLQSILLIWLPIGFLFWFLLLRPQQQERKRREAMLAALKKNDRVITVGGIYGVVTNVHREADEVTIKVDESANVKLRVTVGSIARMLPEAGPSDASSR